MLQNILICPGCMGKLEHAASKYVCCSCSLTYKIREGIPILLVEEAEGVREDTAESTFDNKKEQVKQGYTMVAESLQASGIADAATFLNLGYAENENLQYARFEPYKNCLNRNSVKLLLEVIGEYDFSNKKLLEVGCGRGGNIDTVNRYFTPQISIGVDLCEASIRFCKSYCSSATRHFCVGDAEKLPFPGDFFDVVLNIESSDAYPHIHRFYDHVYRVLKKGGHFLYSDIMPTDIFSSHLCYLKNIGFEVAREADITSNVLLSCYEVAKKRMRAYENVEEMEELKVLEDFLAVPGSKVYEEMKRGIQSYRIYELVK